MRMESNKDLKVLLVIYFLSGLLPIFFHQNLNIMNILILCFIWGVVAASWDLIMGVAGIFTFGQVAFYVIGAYSSAILTRTFGISPWLGILAGGLITCLVGILVAIPCLKLKGSYVALVTFAVHMILEPFLKSNPGRAIGTGGPQGILSIPPLKFFSYTYDTMELVPWFYTVFLISLAAFLVIYKVIHSSWGLAFITIRDSEQFAASIGIDGFKYKLGVFGISSFLTGMIGAVYAHYVGMLSHRLLGLDLFLILMVMLVLGGIGRFPGALIGAFITVFLSEWLRPLETYRNVALGAMVVLLVIFMRQGIAGLLLPTDKIGPLDRLWRNKITKMVPF